MSTFSATGLMFKEKDTTITSGTTTIGALSFWGEYVSKIHSLCDEKTFSGFFIITVPQIAGGKPILRGTRISVHHIVELRYILNWSIQQISDEYPYLNKEQIEAALEYYESHTKEIDNYIEQERRIDDKVSTAFLSESSLAKDWLKPEEDKAWQDL